MTEDVVQFLLKRILLQSVFMLSCYAFIQKLNINHLLYNKRYKITGCYAYAHFATGVILLCTKI